MAKPGCGCGGGNAGVRQAFRGPGSPNTRDAIAAASAESYTVLTAAGTPTGRTFTSLLAAQGYADRIGGTTKTA